MKARIYVTLRKDVLDPQGKAIEGSLQSFGIEGIKSLRQGKLFDIELDVQDAQKARDILRESCEKLLANLVIETYTIELFA